MKKSAVSIVSVAVDWENNAETFWDALRARKDGKTLEAAIDSGSVTTTQRDLLQSLPGYSDGPKHSTTALIFRGRPVGATRGQMTRVDIKLPPELLSSARAEASRRGITFSALVRLVLQNATRQE